MLNTSSCNSSKNKMVSGLGGQITVRCRVKLGSLSVSERLSIYEKGGNEVGGKR